MSSSESSLHRRPRRFVGVHAAAEDPWGTEPDMGAQSHYSPGYQPHRRYLCSSPTQSSPDGQTLCYVSISLCNLTWSFQLNTLFLFINYVVQPDIIVFRLTNFVYQFCCATGHYRFQINKLVLSILLCNLTVSFSDKQTCFVFNTCVVQPDIIVLRHKFVCFINFIVQPAIIKFRYTLFFFF